MTQHYDVLLFKDGKLLEFFPKSHDIELDSCITLSYLNGEDIEVMITYPLDGLEMKITYKGEW